MIGTNQVLYFGVAAHRTGDAHKGGYLAAYLFEWIDYTCLLYTSDAADE